MPQDTGRLCVSAKNLRKVGAIGGLHPEKNAENHKPLLLEHQWTTFAKANLSSLTFS